MTTYQVIVSRPTKKVPYSWTVLGLNLQSTTPRLDDVKRDVAKFIADSSTPHDKDFDVEMFVRFDPDAAREVHGGAIRMCNLLGFHPGERQRDLSHGSDD
ncbi:MAG TPA: hypothetical protein VFE52_06145 [Devosia sp.]|nr:hypothetical protein [Devosia sp.]